MQSFSADEDDIEVEKTGDKGEKLNEMKERNISATSSELESYENEWSKEKFSILFQYILY